MTLGEQMENISQSAADFSPPTLIVEDNADSAEVLSALMQNYGFDSACVGSAGEAIDYLQGALPENLILDLMLPDVSGTTVLQYIRERHLPIRVAVVTAASAARVAADAVTLDPDVLFIKPIDYPRLIAWLAQPDTSGKNYN
jgi:CheY-like chemotaxis protein